MSESKKRRRDPSVGGERVTNSKSTGEEFKVHRCRFVDWTPEPIMALVPDASGSRLALSRKGGAIEVWIVTRDGFHQSLYIPGSELEDKNDMSHAVLSLAWVQDRLFGADLDGEVFEVDLHREERKDETSSYGGPVWCMATSVHHNKIAVGCEDGRLRLFEVQGDSQLEYLRTFKATSGGRVLSTCWHPHADHKNEVFSAGVDGLIRKWDMETMQPLLQIETESYGKSSSPCIWSMLVMNDSTVFTGDSEGHIQVWDASARAGGIMLYSFHEHRADVTSLAMSKDQRAVFATGLDPRVAMFRKVAKDESTGMPSSWVYAYSHRPHSHDVRGLAVVDSGRTLVSGGNDTQLCHYPVSQFMSARPIKVSPFLHRPLVHITRKVDVMLVQHSFHIELWRPKAQKLLLTMKFNDRLGIRCSALSPDGTLLACSDDHGLKVFSIDYSNKDAPVPKRVRFDDPNDTLVRGAVPVACCFGGSSKLLVCALQSGNIVVLNVKSGTKHKAVRVTTLVQLSAVRKESTSPRAVQRVVLSNDGQWLACGDASGTITVFSMDTFEQACEIHPAMINGVVFTSFVFQPQSDRAVLAVTGMDNNVTLINVEENRVEPWSKEHANRLDPRLTQHRDRLLGISFAPKRPTLACVWGQSFFGKLDLNAKGAEGSSYVSVPLHDRIRPIVHAQFISRNEILVLEAPWFKVMRTFQEPLKQKFYGSGGL